MKLVEEVLHMNEGIGDTSYANNSLLQQTAIVMTKPITQGAIASVYTTLNPKIISIADLGCSSGPNTFLAVSNLVKAVNSRRRKLGRASPEFVIYLNDLPINDFNTVFRSLPRYEKELRREMGDEFGECFFNGVGGSFHGRLFPTNTLHFVHSSYSLHWLSQVPKGIEENKRNICMASESSASVIKAYSAQFERDFSTFLNCRSQELVKGGRMVLIFMSRENKDSPFHVYELLANALNQLVQEGLVEEEKLNSFNFPLYTPTLSEVKFLVEKNGFFTIDHLETFHIHWNVYDDGDNNNNNNNIMANTSVQRGYNNIMISAYRFAGCMRAVTESTLVNHFGEEIIDEIFTRYTNIVADFMSQQDEDKTKYTHAILSLLKN